MGRLTGSNVRLRIWAYALTVCLGLVGCGGGGSSGPSGGAASSGSPEGGVDNSWLTFSPAAVSLTTTDKGYMPSISITATSNKTIAQKINIAIIDSVGVLDPKGLSISELSITSYLARLQLAPTLAPGNYRGAFKVKLCLDDPLICNQPYPGSPWLIPFDIQVTPWAQPRTVHKLLVSNTGIALTSLPNASRLTASINVSDNLNAGALWQAQSNQPWLTVTPSGVSGSKSLQIQADPSGLPVNTLSYATISVTSPDASVAASEPVVVAIWKGSSAPSQLATTPSSAGYSRLLPDPVRPYVYAHGGGGVISIFNIYTGAQVGSLTVAGAKFDKMIASQNGSFLYAVDRAAGQVRVFDLRGTGQLVNSWPLNANIVDPSTVDMLYARPNGVGVVLMTTGVAYRASDGKVLTGNITQNPYASFSQTSMDSGFITASSDGTRIYSTGSGKAFPSTPFYMDIDYGESNGGVLSSTRPFLADGTIGSGGGGIALSADGSKVYTHAYSSPIWAWSANTFSSIGQLTPGLALEGPLIVAVDGRIVVPANDYYNQKFYIISPQGALLKTLSAPVLPGLPYGSNAASNIRAQAAGLAVSSDAFVVAMMSYHQNGNNSFDYMVTFMPILP